MYRRGSKKDNLSEIDISDTRKRVRRHFNLTCLASIPFVQTVDFSARTGRIFLLHETPNSSERRPLLGRSGKGRETDGLIIIIIALIAHSFSCAHTHSSILTQGTHTPPSTPPPQTDRATVTFADSTNVRPSFQGTEGNWD